MKSIRQTLLIWLSAGLTSGILLAAALLYVQARDEANEIFDYQMKQVAASLPVQSLGGLTGSFGGPGNGSDIVIQIWGENGLRMFHSHEWPGLPQRTELGFANIATRSGVWRVYSAQQGDAIVQVAQPLSARRQVAADMAFRTVAPLFVIFPFLGVLIWLTVGKGLAPVRRVASDLQRRDAGALAPIDEAGLPREIRPLTRALNDLLRRLHLSMNVQRAFVADAAHELRTPLAALKLQIQLAERARDDAERNAAFAELRHGFDRATHMVQQLLTLARQEPGAAGRQRKPVDLAETARNVVAEYAAAAAARHIDLGLESMGVPGAATFEADPDALHIMIRNLVDNAIRYTPENGKVDVLVQGGNRSCSVTVRDNGPGIPAHERERVFDRFYRVAGTDAQGSGLGLAIVKQIADVHGARIEMDDASSGLSIRIVFPRQA